MRALAVSLAVAFAAPAAAEPIVGAAAGGGWDSNLSRGGDDAPAVPGGFWGARAILGWAFPLGERAELSAEAGWDGTFYPALSGLDEHRPAAALAWTHELGGTIRARLSATGALRLAEERARSGSELGANLTIRWQAASRLALRAGGGFVRRAANDEVYAGDGWRARAGAEVELWSEAFLDLGYGADVGEDTFYAPAAPSGTAALPMGNGPGGPGTGSGSGTGPGGRYGLPVGTFGDDRVAYRASRVGHVLSVDLVQALPAGFFVSAGYAYATVQGDVQSWASHSVTAEVGWHL